MQQNKQLLLIRLVTQFRPPLSLKCAESPFKTILGLENTTFTTSLSSRLASKESEIIPRLNFRFQTTVVQRSIDRHGAFSAENDKVLIGSYWFIALKMTPWWQTQWPSFRIYTSNWSYVWKVYRELGSSVCKPFYKSDYRAGKKSTETAQFQSNFSYRSPRLQYQHYEYLDCSAGQGKGHARLACDRPTTVLETQ